MLRTGIVCVGAKLSAVDILTLGGAGLPLVAGTVFTGLAGIRWIGRKFNIDPQLTALTAAGTSICGVTAITALAPVIGADKRQQAVAVANVVAFGTFGMLTYPYVAHAMLPTPEQVGLFLGTHST